MIVILNKKEILKKFNLDNFDSEMIIFFFFSCCCGYISIINFFLFFILVWGSGIFL